MKKNKKFKKPTLKSMISLYKKRGFKKPVAQERKYMRGYNDEKKFKIK